MLLIVVIEDNCQVTQRRFSIRLGHVRHAPAQAEQRQQPKRAPLTPQFPRTVIHYEPDKTQCLCGCLLQRLGEDDSEKLNHPPGVLTVEQHVCGKLACRQRQTLTQAPLPSQVIYKGIPLPACWRT
jgi:transposase